MAAGGALRSFLFSLPIGFLAVPAVRELGGLLPARLPQKKVFFMSGDAIPRPAPSRVPVQVQVQPEDRPLGLRDALRWLGITLLVVASLVVIGAFLLMPVVPAVATAGR